MARSGRTTDRDELEARQRAVDMQRRRLDRVRDEARREKDITEALRGEKRRREHRETVLARRIRTDSRSTKRFFADLHDIVKLPCGSAPDHRLLANLARHRRDWFRPLFSWNPQGESLIDQQSSMIRHLLTRYEVPAFMERAWYLDDLSEGREHRTWFLRMTRGENIRACSPPIRLTHRAAHLFVQAPEECTIVGAMRRAQYLAMGGSTTGAAELLRTFLGYPQSNEGFWETALQFLAEHEREMRPGQIWLLVDYFQARITGRTLRAEPLQQAPIFSLKGRTLANLIRDAEAYRTAHPITGRQEIWWKNSSIGEWEPTEDASGRTWSIVELLNSEELGQEGDAMHHCVAGYSRQCKSGVTSIWSVRCRGADTSYSNSILTVEVRNHSREIVQARGKYNQGAMAPEAGPLLRSGARQVVEWADREGLSIGWGLLGWDRSRVLREEGADD